MKIKIDNKYLTIHDDSGAETNYFEHFESKDKKRIVIKICVENKEGEKFLKKNSFAIQFADVYWFSSKKLIYRVMFIQGDKNTRSHLILIEPKLLTI